MLSIKLRSFLMLKIVRLLKFNTSLAISDMISLSINQVSNFRNILAEDIALVNAKHEAILFIS
jgi:hypothetical protein